MGIISHSIILPVSAEHAWDTILDVEKFPKRMKFIKKVTVKSALVLGGEWEDFHNIVFLPLTTNHKIIVFNKPNLLVYDLNLPFNWEMQEKIEIKPLKNMVKITITITYDLKNRVLTTIGGRVLEHRLSQVIQSAFRYYKNQNSNPF